MGSSDRIPDARRDRGVRPGAVAPYVLLLACWLAAYPFTRHYVNPDGTSYVVVAQRLLDGEWAAAVNGYWGPLLSWSMAPLMLVGVPGLPALRLVLLAGALASLHPLRLLARRAGASRGATDAVLLATAPFLVYTALFGAYPDVLLSLALLWCCALLFHPDFPTSTPVAVGVGLVGGVAYLAKAYAVPVVLVLVPVGVVVHLVSTRGVRIGPAVRAGALALGSFAVVFGCWAGLLSVTYGEPTFSTSAGFNADLVAPGSAGNPLNHPGLYPPARDGDLSVWEEPSRLEIPMRDGTGTGPSDPSGAQSDSDELGHRVENAVANTRIVAGSVVRRGLPLALLALVAVAAYARRRALPSPALTGPLLAGAISAGGLALIIAIERYTWFAVLALVPAAAVGFDLLLRRRPSWRPVTCAALVVLMGASAAHGLAPRWNLEREATVAVAALNTAGGLDAAVATTGDGRWGMTQRLCLEVGCRYLGRPTARDPSAATLELRAAGVDYLVVWDGERDNGLAGLPAEGPGVLGLYAVTPQGLQLERRIPENRQEPT